MSNFAVISSPVLKYFPICAPRRHRTGDQHRSPFASVVMILTMEYSEIPAYHTHREREGERKRAPSSIDHIWTQSSLCFCLYPRKRLFSLKYANNSSLFSPQRSEILMFFLSSLNLSGDGGKKVLYIHWKLFFLSLFALYAKSAIPNSKVLIWLLEDDVWPAKNLKSGPSLWGTRNVMMYALSCQDGIAGLLLSPWRIAARNSGQFSMAEQRKCESCPTYQYTRWRDNWNCSCAI